MYTVLLVDDEPIVVEGISQLVSWQNYNTKLIGTASDGFGALELIEQEKPDIVICDIQMPGMNGLELIATAQSVCPNTAYIILSGYSEFRFAKRALELGVRHYLLKPCNEVEIGSVLDRLVSELEMKRREAYESRLMKKKLDVLARTMGTNPAEIDLNLYADRYEVNRRRTFAGESAHSPGHDVVKQMVEYVSAHYANPQISLIHLSKQKFFMNPEYLGKLFRDTMGVRFSDYLVNLRIERAKTLMQGSTDITIGEIAERTGFGDNSQYFSQVFKRVTGRTPSQFKRELSV